MKQATKGLKMIGSNENGALIEEESRVHCSFGKTEMWPKSEMITKEHTAPPLDVRTNAGLIVYLRKMLLCAIDATTIIMH